MSWDKNLGALLKTARKRARLSGDALAKKLGVSRSAISAWELAYSEPSPEFMDGLAKILKIPRSQLDSPRLPSITPATGGRVGGPERIAEGEWNVPEIGTVGASQNRTGVVTVDETAMKNAGRRFKLRVLDRSMEPIAQEGQWVVIDREADKKSGDLVVADLAEDGAEQLYFKRFVLANGRYEFHSVNENIAAAPLVRKLAPRHWWKVVGTQFE